MARHGLTVLFLVALSETAVLAVMPKIAMELRSLGLCPWPFASNLAAWAHESYTPPLPNSRSGVRAGRPTPDRDLSWPPSGPSRRE